MLSPTSTDQIIGDLVGALDALERRGDEASWEKADLYISGYQQLWRLPEYAHKHGQARERLINNNLRSEAQKIGFLIPRPSFLSNAVKLYATWADLFTVDRKELPYDAYMRIAVCSLPRESKGELRQWAERERPKQGELRQRIKFLVDERNGIYKPDFEYKVSNFWKFNSHHENAGYGGVHPEIYANLLYLFTEPGDIILDPMAGTGLLAHTLTAYRFFREQYQAKGSGPRRALMSDIAPTASDILAADASIGLPFEDGVAKLALLDPPYMRIADEKAYANLGADLCEWLATLRSVIVNIRRCLCAGGLIAVITDDVLRKGEHHPIAYHITAVLSELGFTPNATIYNHNPNFVYTMGPAMMARAMDAGLLCNGCKIIQVAAKRGAA